MNRGGVALVRAWLTASSVLAVACPGTGKLDQTKDAAPAHTPTQAAQAPSELSILGTLPAFSFTDQSSQPFESQQLAGKVWVANFIFTRCPTICPASTAKMAALQRGAADFGTGFHLVSFSVDPQYDTPERLKAFGETFAAEPKRWSFLTGELEAIKSVVVEGMKIGMDGDTRDAASIVHGTHFVLVDTRMRIRGYYDLNRAKVTQTVLRDVRLLMEQAGRIE